MTAENVLDRVLAVVGDMAPLRDVEVTPDARLREDLGYDSLSLVELAAVLEDEFDLPASAELDAEVTETVREVEQVLAEKLGIARG